jgi:NADH-quinone oxidoreductase subunit G
VSDVTLTIDGREITVPQGTLIIRAAEQLGIEIPRFCDHPFLAPAGACRQCFVQIEGQPKLATSCTMTVAPDMVVLTQNTSDEAAQAQVANLEFLLLNHPLDCPICDRGGECPLQDQALAFGPGESRFREAKRVYPKPVPLSPLVNLDRERCVLCARCTRFCDEISGDRFIELFARGAGERVSIAAGEDFRSPFSGNTIQICPVGALTSTPYRFVARPFDLTSGDSICNHCSAGCNVRVDERRGEIVRVLARDNVDVNDAWICDKGRFAFTWPDAPDRVTMPLLRGQGLEGASFGEVLTWVAARCEGARVAFLTGGRLMDEDYYALSKLARTVFGTNDLDHRRAPGPASVERYAAATPMAVTAKHVERAKAVLVVGLDAENEVPILHLRLRKAARNGADITVVHPRRTRLRDVATHVLVAPGEDAALLMKVLGGETSGEASLDAAVSALREAGPDGIVLAGERSAPAAELALQIAAATGARFGYVTRRANDRGALRAGVHPSLLPGGRTMTEPDDVERVWGPVVNRRSGRDAIAILEACAQRDIDVLFLIGIDPLRDAPDAALARRALDNVPVTVVQSLELGDLEPFADAFLPAAPSIEKRGRMTDWEGRTQKIGPVREARGLSRPDWEIFAGLALAAGGDLGFETLEELHAEMDGLLASRSLGTATDTAPAGVKQPAGMQLVSYPLLIDDGRLSRDAPELKAALEDDPFVEIHPDDAGSIGLVDGGRAIVRTEAGEAQLPVRLTPHIARGVIFVPFNQRSAPANRLLSGSFTTTARIEAADAVEEVSA